MICISCNTSFFKIKSIWRNKILWLKDAFPRCFGLHFPVLPCMVWQPVSVNSSSRLDGRPRSPQERVPGTAPTATGTASKLKTAVGRLRVAHGSTGEIWSAIPTLLPVNHKPNAERRGPAAGRGARTCRRSSPDPSTMGGGNGQKSKMARERNLEKNKGAKGARLFSLFLQ